MRQRETLDILKLGYNIFLTGPPGSGKTFLLNKYIDYLKKKRRGVAITASTGVAATHMGGVTIHSWSGLGLKEKLDKQDLKKLLKKSYLKKRFKNTSVLIIDEVSMMHAFQFDLINQICQAFKDNSQPFGGMQVVCSGDLFQLPPVQKWGDAKFITESAVWENMDIKICYLEEQYRQEGGELFKLLNFIRNNQDEEAWELLQGSECEKNTFSITPTKLYTHNIDVDAINHFELNKIKGKEFEYFMQAAGNKDIAERLKKGCLAPEKLVLKQGAKVMFVKNNFDKGYINGTLGKVIEFNEENLPIVETLEGERITAEPVSWTIEEEEKVKAEISQIPLRLAWAITVHKSQGMSLEAAEIDLSKSFVEGMGYVALSRLGNLSGLKLIGINKLAFLVNQEILEVDRNFKRMSEKMVEDFRRMSSREKERKQNQFLYSLNWVSWVKKNKEEKPETISTYEQTKNFVSEKLSIKEISKRRGLTEDTILQHLEKLVTDKEKIDLRHLQPSKKRFEKIRMAFQQSGSWQLTPVREILGENFFYRELRLARLSIKTQHTEEQKEEGTKKLTGEEISNSKIYRCQNCGRPIKHRGNCLPCNIKLKNEKPPPER